MRKRIRKKRRPLPGIETTYFRSLNAVIDRLFQEAFKQRLNWYEMGKLSGLSNETVRRLGRRETQRPQFRTIELLANALGGKLEFEATTKRVKIKRSWTPRVFDGRSKKRLKAA